MMPPQKGTFLKQLPSFLQPGDTVGVLAPASRLDYEEVLPGLRVLREQWQLQVQEGTTLRLAHHQFAGTDEERFQDLQAMLDDPSIKAILAARGGYGCSRLLDRLDFTEFRKNPKWVVGFSDLTALMAHLHGMGFASLHASMVKLFTKAGGELALESLRKMLFGEQVAYEVSTHPFNRLGSAEAELVGGNLCLLAHLVGSASDLDTAGKVLFLEDVGEYYYNLDRMLIQLQRAGKLRYLAGLVVGQFTEMRDNRDPTFGQDAYEIIQQHVSAYSYPVCYNFPVGHVADNRALGVGMPVQLKVGESNVTLSFPLPQST
ncbi:S66 peptidase family protein [Rhabdobacter roseus]|nr:LD-carboxypeptidase [Rhabdobacter roseus]